MSDAVMAPWGHEDHLEITISAWWDRPDTSVGRNRGLFIQLTPESLPVSVAADDVEVIPLSGPPTGASGDSGGRNPPFLVFLSGNKAELLFDVRGDQDAPRADAQ